MARNPTVYSKLLLPFVNVTASQNVTVPAGFAWIVRDIDVYGGTGSSGHYLNVGAGPTLFFWTALGPVSATLFAFQWRGRQVFTEGMDFGVYPSGGSWSGRISGYELTLP